MGSQYTSEVDRRSKAREKLDALVQSRTETLSLLTDLYQLTMALGYLRQGVAETPVVCEAFVRRLARNRGWA